MFEIFQNTFELRLNRKHLKKLTAVSGVNHFNTGVASDVRRLCVKPRLLQDGFPLCD